MKQTFSNLLYRFLGALNKNTLLFFGGLAGVGHETLFSHLERPSLLILFAAMMGLPAFLSPGIHMHQPEGQELPTDTTKDQSDGSSSASTQ